MTASAQATIQIEFTSLEEFPAIRDTLRATFKSGKTRDVNYRKTQLLQLAYLFRENEERWNEAFEADLGRPKMESTTIELNGIISECVEAWKNVDTWAQPDSAFSFASRLSVMRPKVYKQPKGVGLVIGPFNYPILCSIGPLVGAIAAGCPCVVKMSELTPTVSGLLAELWPNYMDMDFTRVVNGAIPETTALLNLQWDHIVFSGSNTAGKIVALAAAKHLTPTTLELGGRSPVFMDTNTDLKIATRRLLWAKAINAGQTCTAPNHIFVPEHQQDKLVEAFRQTYAEFYPEGPEESKSVSRIATKAHYNRLNDLIDDTDGEIICGGMSDAETRFIAPTIVKDVKLDDPLMQSEIFGPILPIVPVKDYQEALDYTNAGDHPLALYIYSDNPELKKRLIENTISGAVDINECCLHVVVPGLPFGGLGQSGSGAYTGKFSFDTFTHNRSSIHNPKWTEWLFGWRYPPVDKMTSSASMRPIIPAPRPGSNMSDVIGSGGWLSRVSPQLSLRVVLVLAAVLTVRQRSSPCTRILGSYILGVASGASGPRLIAGLLDNAQLWNFNWTPQS
ncbi:hypothetical protein FRB97_009602 [Tulasnella sp. 331]|nr:hypothetical protein FRB97_009602 [Tulasnella sp. 331]